MAGTRPAGTCGQGPPQAGTERVQASGARCSILQGALQGQAGCPASACDPAPPAHTPPPAGQGWDGVGGASGGRVGGAKRAPRPRPAPK